MSRNPKDNPDQSTTLVLIHYEPHIETASKLIRKHSKSIQQLCLF
jgi:hypothetical protein